MSFETVALEHAIEALIDYRGRTPKKAASGVRLITAKVIKDGRITDDHLEYVAAEDYDSWMRRGIPRRGDLLVTTEAPLGEVAELQTDERVALAQRVIVVRADGAKMDPRFMFHALRSPFVQAELARRATGTTVPGIKQAELRQIRLPSPPLPTQRRIAAILSAYDELLDNNLERIELLHEMAAALYREWFVHFRFPGHEQRGRVDSALGPIPASWRVAPIEAISSLVKRGIAPKYTTQPGQGELILNQRCIRNHRICLGPARRQVKQVPEPRYLRVGDVLINSTGVGTLGRAAQVLDELPRTTVDTHVTIVRPREGVDLHYFGMKLLHMQPVWASLGAGATGQTELGRRWIRETLVAVAPAELQAQFSARVRAWRQLAQALQGQSAALRQTRDLLLPGLVWGEIEVEP